MRRALPVLLAAALVVAVVLGLRQAGDGGGQTAEVFSLSRARAALAGAPAPLAALHAQSARLLDGGTKSFRRRLESLRGHPVVVNKWASWCGPCRVEFPHFQAVATARGREIAFLGVDSGDNRQDAAQFLLEFPVPFPSYVDPDNRIAKSLGSPYFPTTIFFDAQGERAFIRQGQYKTRAALESDIDRYLGA